MGAKEEPRLTAKRRHPDVAAYVSNVPLPARALVRDLRALVHAEVKDASENLYYGVPFFFIRGVGFCHVSPAKKHVTLGFVWGTSIRDPTGLLQGTGKSPVRKVTLAFDDPIPDAAADWIRQSAQVAREAAERVSEREGR